jgi:hypothetical protein
MQPLALAAVGLAKDEAAPSRVMHLAGRALLGGRAVAICVVPWSECERARDAREASLSAETLARYADTTGLHWVDRLASVDPLLRVVK